MESSNVARERTADKKTKLMCKNDTNQYLIDQITHCGQHRCSNYCWKNKTKWVEYNKEQYTGPEKDSLREDDGGTKKVNVPIKDWTIDYKMKQKFDASGENNFTEGMP